MYQKVQKCCVFQNLHDFSKNITETPSKTQNITFEKHDLPIRRAIMTEKKLLFFHIKTHAFNHNSQNLLFSKKLCPPNIALKETFKIAQKVKF